MTNNYRDGGLMTPGQQPGQGATNPVIRMLDMSGGHQPGPQPGYQSQEHSPRDSHSTSPPSLQIPSHQSHGSSKDVSPVESPHSHSPPGPPIPTHPHQLHLQVDNNVMDEKPRQIFLLYFPYLSTYL